MQLISQCHSCHLPKFRWITSGPWIFTQHWRKCDLHRKEHLIPYTIKIDKVVCYSFISSSYLYRTKCNVSFNLNHKGGYKSLCNDPAGWKETINTSSEVDPSFPVQLDSCMPNQLCLSFQTFCCNPNTCSNYHKQIKQNEMHFNEGVSQPHCICSWTADVCLTWTAFK